MSNPSGTRKHSGLLVAAGCLGALVIALSLVVVAYVLLRTKELRTPLILALPDCKAGVYTEPRTKPVGLFDDIANDAAKRACDGTRGFQGEAILVGHNLTLKIHNSDYAPLVLAQVRLNLTPSVGTSSQREYRLEGKVPPYADGEMHVVTNLDSNNVKSFSANITLVYFQDSSTSSP